MRFLVPVILFAASGAAVKSPGRMEDLSAWPTTSAAAAPTENPSASLSQRPALRVAYDTFLRMQTTNGTLQLFRVNVTNNGPGHIEQLGTRIEGFANATDWWGLDALASNNTFVYLPAYRSPLRPGDSWSFGFTLASNATEFPKVEPIYGQLADGRFFNYTSIIEPPQNPTGTSASLYVLNQTEFWQDGQRHVLTIGSVENTGSYPLRGVGVIVDNFTDNRGFWHLLHDPQSNTTYLPLREGPLMPGGSTSFGVIQPAVSGYPNVSLRHVTTPNALFSLTDPGVAAASHPSEDRPLNRSQRIAIDTAAGGRSVPYPLVPVYAGVRTRPLTETQGQQRGGASNGTSRGETNTTTHGQGARKSKLRMRRPE